MKTFREEVRKFYEPYYRDGDEAHLIDHADDVCDLALKINQKYDEKLVILASYLHDLFNAKNRSIHNELAYEYVLKAEDRFLKQLNNKELKGLLLLCCNIEQVLKVSSTLLFVRLSLQPIEDCPI